MVQKTYDTLNDGVADGYGPRYHRYNEQNSDTIQKLRQNIYQFSAAKTYQQLSEYNSFLVDENGKLRSFGDFKQLVLKEHPKYNQNYLQSEFQTAKAAGQMAAKWEGFQRNKDRFPYLKYMTVGDDHVRDDHEKLHGFIAHIDDPIWDIIYPPNGWRCRCFIVQTDQRPSGEVPDFSFITPEFSVNVGKTGVMFNTKAHPYFVIPKKDEQRMKLAFESMKLRLGYGKAVYVAKNGKKLFVHPWAQKSDLVHNINIAKAFINQNSVDVKIRPHVEGIKTGIGKNGLSNPEFLIDGDLADVKTLGIKNSKVAHINSVFKSGKNQGNQVLIIENMSQLTIERIFQQIKGEINSRVENPFVKIWVLDKNKFHLYE